MAHLIRILRSLSFLRLFCTGDKMGYTKRLIRKSVAAQWVFTLREDVVRSEGRTSRSPVLQALIFICILLQRISIGKSSVFLNAFYFQRYSPALCLCRSMDMESSPNTDSNKLFEPGGNRQLGAS